MNVTTARNNVISLTTSETPESKDCCIRTEHIVLAILASLAAFVFLPLGTAIAITFVVALGAVCSALSDRQTDSEILKQNLGNLPDSDPFLKPEANIWGHLGIKLSFQTKEALEIFIERHEQKFVNGTVVAIKDGDEPKSVLIEKINVDALTQLREIYGEDFSMSIF